MTAVATDITSAVATRCDRAWDAFCEDMGGMFDVEMRCTRRQAAWGPVRGVQEHFPKLAAAHFVQAQGTWQGAFSLLFDAGGIFVLGGVIVMLPEPRIREGLKRGQLQDADSLQDAAREVGNLLVGSWDRVFRECCPGHKHFLKTGTFLGKPWDSSGPQELQTSEPALVVRYEMTVAPYPSFQCAVVLPEALLTDLADAAPAPAEKAGVSAASGGGQGSPNANERVGEPQPHAAVGPENDPRGRGSCGAAPVPAPAATGPVPPQKPAAPVSPLPAPAPPGPRGPQTRTEASGDPSPAAPGRSPAPVAAAPSLGVGADALSTLLRLPAAQIMDRQVVWATPDESVQEVLAKMQQHNVGYVLVGAPGKLEGLVSSSNILGAVSLYLRPLFAQWHRSEDDATLNVKVKWIMSRPVRTVRPDTTVAGLIESLRRCGGRCLPVVDAGGTVQGIVTVFDILLRLPEAQGSGVWQGRPPQAPALLL